MYATAFRFRIVLLAGLGVIVLAGVAVAAFYLGVWLATPPNGLGPDLLGPSLRITAYHEGASAEEVESTVTVPLESALAGLEGVVSSESISRDGSVTLTLYLRAGTDADEALVTVQDRIAQAAPALPALVQRQGVELTKGGQLPALWLVLSSPDRSRDQLTLRKYADARLAPLVTVLPGVSAANPGPGTGPRIHIWLDAEKLNARKLSITDVVRSLRELAEEPDQDVTPDQLPDLIVWAEIGGRIVRLKDVGRVEMAAAEPGDVARWHREPVAFLAVEGDNPAQLVESIQDRLSVWQRRLPRGTELHLVPGPALPGSEAFLVEGRLPASASMAQVRDLAERVAASLERLADPKAERLVPAVLALPADHSSAFRLYVALCPPADRAWTQDEVRTRVGRELNEQGDMIWRIAAPSLLERPRHRRAPIVLQVSGPAMDEAYRFAEEIRDRLNRSGVVVDLWPDHAGLAPQLTLDVDRDKAKRLGVAVTEVLETLHVSSRSLDVQEVGLGLRVGMETDRPNRFADVNRLKVPNDRGEMIPLSALVAIREAPGPAAISRIDGKRCLLINAAPAPGVPLEEARRRCRLIAAQTREDFGLPGSYQVGCPDNSDDAR
jgi:multidrug efflux pump subunit AcrB